VQLLSCWRFELGQPAWRTVLCTDTPNEFRARLESHLAALKDTRFERKDVAALAAHDFGAIRGDACELAAKIEERRQYFAPHGDAPVAKLPVALSHRSHAATPQLLAAVVCGQVIFLRADMERVREHVRSLVALQLFASESDARAACMRCPGLLKLQSWASLVRVLAAVRAAGGSTEDAVSAIASGHSWERVLLAFMFREFWGCVLVQST
jgi:hypothetical protein